MDQPSSAPPISIDDKAIVDAVLARRPDVRAVYRYGSTLTGYARQDSDVDIAVLADEPLSLRERLSLAVAVGGAAGREADIMDLRHAGLIARLQAIGGRKLYEDDPLVVGRFETQTAREHQDFAPRRRLFEAQLLEHGWPHA